MDHMQSGVTHPEGAPLSPRDARLKELYLDGVHIDVIGRDVGLSSQAVKNKASELGLTRKRGRNVQNSRCVTSIHATVGQKLSNYRHFTPGQSMDAKTVAKILGVSLKRLTQIERGQAEISLSETIKISELIKVPLDKLLTPGVYAQ